MTGTRGYGKTVCFSTFPEPSCERVVTQEFQFVVEEAVSNFSTSLNDHRIICAAELIWYGYVLSPDPSPRSGLVKSLSATLDR